MLMLYTIISKKEKREPNDFIFKGCGIFFIEILIIAGYFVCRLEGLFY